MPTDSIVNDINMYISLPATAMTRTLTPLQPPLTRHVDGDVRDKYVHNNNIDVVVARAQ